MEQIIWEILGALAGFLVIAVTILLACCPYVLLVCGTIYAIKATARFLRK